MTLETINVEQRSPDWFAARAGIVTASVVGRLVAREPHKALDYKCPACGAYPQSPCISRRKDSKGYRPPIIAVHSERSEVARADETPGALVVATGDDARGLIASLVAERITGHVEEGFVSADMWRGIEEEPRARDHYSENRAEAKECGFMVRREPTWTLGYSPDGLVGDDGLIEIKSPRQKKHLQTFLMDEVPAEHMPQLQAGLLVTGRKWIDFISWHGGMPAFVKRVHPDPHWQKAIVAAVEQFELAAAVMQAKYDQATTGLPQTERAPELEMSL